MTTQTALILGPNGKFGRNAAEAFEHAGWTVHRFDRARDDLMLAAQQADVIVMGWNPAGYEKWDAELLPMHERAVAAAKASGATIILPGNVYVFGPDAPRGWGADTPHLAQNPLARLRMQVEAMYRDAGVQTILLRAGDFIDTKASGNWFDMFITAKVRKGHITYPGDLDTPHSWAYLPDMARAAVMLAGRRDSLARFEDVPFPGYTLTGRDLAEGLTEALGHEVEARRLSWLKFQLARPFMPLLKGVFEMRYLWDLPQHLDARKFTALCPEFRATPLDIALRQAVGASTDTAGQLATA